MKEADQPLPEPAITELDLYQHEPWELPSGKAYNSKAKEWYFISPRHRKYPLGERPSRSTALGYWRASGPDRPVVDNGSNKPVRRNIIGAKKTLVYYIGKSKTGERTNWVVHEYRLDDGSSFVEGNKRKRTTEPKPNMPKPKRLDGWVLCRIFYKGDLDHGLYPDPASNSGPEVCNSNNNANSYHGPVNPKSDSGPEEYINNDNNNGISVDTSSYPAPVNLKSYPGLEECHNNYNNNGISFDPSSHHGPMNLKSFSGPEECSNNNNGLSIDPSSSYPGSTNPKSNSRLEEYTTDNDTWISFDPSSYLGPKNESWAQECNNNNNPGLCPNPTSPTSDSVPEVCNNDDHLGSSSQISHDSPLPPPIIDCSQQQDFTAYDGDDVISIYDFLLWSDE